MTTTERHPVYLAIYDLSMGTAQQLSTMFLGPQNSIRMIPHTSILAYDREYFFSSGGIQHCSPAEFRRAYGMRPAETLPLGSTPVSRREFEQWFLTPEVLSRFGGHHYHLLERNCNDFSEFACRVGLRLENGVPGWVLEVPDKVMRSPFGGMIAGSMQGLQPFGEGSTVAEPVGRAPPATPLPVSRVPPATTPLLDSHDKLLLSTDASSVGVCIDKIKKSCSDEQTSALEILKQDLTKNPPTVRADTIRPALGNFFHQDTDESTMLYVLMILRLVVLHPPTPQNHELESYLQQIMHRLHLTTQTPWSKPSIRSMAWCTLSNAFSNPHLLQSILYDSPQDLIDASIHDITSQTNPSVKLSSSAFLYNFIHYNRSDTEEHLPDTIVTTLCGMLQDVDAETERTTQYRRILIAGKILKKYEGTAVALVVELGFDEFLRNLVRERERDENCLLASEIVTCFA